MLVTHTMTDYSFSGWGLSIIRLAIQYRRESAVCDMCEMKHPISRANVTKSALFSI